MMTADSVAEMIEWVIELEDNTQMRTLSFDVGNFDGQKSRRDTQRV